MRKGLLLAAASLCVLTACSQASFDDQVAQEAAEDVAAAPQASDAGVTRAEPDAPPAPIARIAYAYRYGLSVPKDRGAELMSRHELACASAGAGYCQVLSAEADWVGREAGGRLELRGQREWIDRFRATLASDATAYGGRVDQMITDGEDVTHRIDSAETGAATAASLTERLRTLQAQRGGSLEQRLQVEREIAALQTRLDQNRLALRDLNDRVASARLTLDYRQGGLMAADHPMRPVARALSDALGLSLSALGLMITLGSIALPIGAIAGLAWWVLRRRRRPAAA